MRIACIVAMLCLSACASDPLALAPPAGVDFTGHWKLNEADSDDPQRLVISQMGGAAPGGIDGSSGGQGGQGGRNSRGGRGGGAQGLSGGGPRLPSVPAVAALSDGLRWPGKEVEVKQEAGVVAVTSAGDSRVFQPAADGLRRPHHRGQDDSEHRRDGRPREREDPPPVVCGWDGRTLVVQSGEADDDHPPFEQRFSVSEDGSRLVEVVGFKGGRTGGFTMSRVWDKVVARGAQ